MDREEIVVMFRLSKNKREQISILADLTDSDEETIIEILRDSGEYVALSKCPKCHKIFPRLLSRYCESCEGLLRKQRTEEQRYKSWLRWQIKRNEVKKKSLIRQIGELEQESKRLKEELNGKV